MPTALRWALIGTVVSIVMTLLIYLLGWMDPTEKSPIRFLGTVLSLAVAAAIIFFGLKSYKASNGGFLTLGRGLSWSMLYGLIAGLLALVWTYVFFAYIGSDIPELALEQAKADLREQNMSDEQMDAALGMVKMFTSPVTFAAFGLIGGFVQSLIFGLIVSAIIKREPRPGDALDAQI